MGKQRDERARSKERDPIQEILSIGKNRSKSPIMETPFSPYREKKEKKEILSSERGKFRKAKIDDKYKKTSRPKDDERNLKYKEKEKDKLTNKASAGVID